MIAIVEQVKQELRAPCAPVCRELGVPRSSLLRWESHQQDGQAVVGRPGPAKVEPFDLDALLDDILRLAFGRQRTRGTGPLYGRYCNQISRRDFQAVVEAARRELRQEEAVLARHVAWLVPGAVWSMDDTEKHWLAGRFGHLHVVMDLHSRYILSALGDDALANGWHVAKNLEDRFLQYGPPLFMKMDGGSNFKHHEVRHLLGAHWAIPLISPRHHPPYNGGVEREHQELQRRISRWIGNDKISARELRWVGELARHEVNHMRRPVLGGRTACTALASGRDQLGRFGRRERKEVFEQIKALAVDIAEQLDEHTNAAAETAFRYAAETWMQSNNIIRVTQNGKVLPSFFKKLSH